MSEGEYYVLENNPGIVQENERLRATVAKQAGEIERLKEQHECHGKPCYYCGEEISGVSANPGKWGIPLCHAGEPGIVKYHHIGCVSERLAERDALTLSLEAAQREIEQLTDVLKRMGCACRPRIPAECEAVYKCLRCVTLDKLAALSATVVSSDSAASGISLISAERSRQVSVEGWNPAHDDEHTNGEMALAAVYYAAPSPICETIPWPWELKWNKRGKHGRIRQLAIAGALIAAEIDRLQRSAALTEQQGAAGKAAEKFSEEKEN